MNVHFQQSTRMGRLVTALGPDELALKAFSGDESVNTLFEYRVEALSTRDDIDFDALVGTHVTIEVDHPDHGVQPFDGIVTQARWAGIDDTGYRYDLVLRPWAWIAGRRRNQRIFHEMSVVDILTELLEAYADLGSPAVEMRLSKSYPTLEYTVQFSESDLDFACRMMEKFGISYYFRHETGSHTMVITDSVAGFDPVPGTRRPFYSAGDHRNVEIEHFWSWRPERNLTTGAMRLVDYNFKKPGAKMETFRVGDAKYAQGQIESFDWPGHYLDLGRGEEAEIGLRVEQERGQDVRHAAIGDCLTLRAGREVELSGDPIHGATGEAFVCLAATHSYVSNKYGTVSAGQAGPSAPSHATGPGAATGNIADAGGHGYSGRYTLSPKGAPLAPRRKTPLSRVHGPQTARVVGEGEIDCDEYGRILVRFHWDLHDQYSMRCRVSQNWASGTWGGMVIPRIGMEVLVEFLDGDPDKPLVTGCVYNGRNAVPYPLPEHKTKSVFRTDSHKSTGFNELSFEDATGAENIALHAQKDQTLKVLHNRMKRVDNDQIESVGSNKSIDVEKNHQEKIGGSMNLFVGGGGHSIPLAAGLAALTGMTEKKALRDASDVGNSFVTSFVQATQEGGAAAEAMSLMGIKAFLTAGKNREVAGADQIAKGTQLGKLLSTVMPISGIKNTFVEKAVLDTVGLARTEQVGLFKNTQVGHTQSVDIGEKQRTSVGKHRSVEVGLSEDKSIGESMSVSVGRTFTLTVGKSSLTLQEDGTIVMSGTHIEMRAENSVKAIAETIDLN
ncbi:MAG: type VI secretion system tip protein TssI/VgrG [Pseudomonadota bacterium]